MTLPAPEHGLISITSAARRPDVVSPDGIADGFVSWVAA